MKNKCRFAIIFALIATSVALLIACSDPEPTRYTVYFDSCGGSAVDSYSLVAGEAIYKPEDPTRELYTFDNWYTEDGERYTFGAGMPEYDITLYARWNAESWVTVTYDANGGEFAGNVTQKTELCKVGSACGITSEAPTRTGYVFSGWYTAANDGDKFSSGTYPVENFTLYAGWGASSDYAYVKYYGNGRLLDIVPVVKGHTIAQYKFTDDIVAGDYYTDAAMTKKYTFGAATADLSLYTTYYTDGLAFNGNTVSGYTGSSSVVYVPSAYNGNAITAVGGKAFYRSIEYAETYGRITKVVLPDTITSIGEGAFQDCTYLADINLTSNLKTIADNAFLNNARLEVLGTINGVTAIGDGAFTGCKLLRAVEFSKSLTSLGANAFADCSELREVTIPNGVTSIGAYAFARCTSLTSVVISANSLASIGEYAFWNCKSLASVSINSATVPVMDGKKVNNSRYSPFWGCSSSLVIRVSADVVDLYKSIYAEFDNGSLSNKFTSIR